MATSWFLWKLQLLGQERIRHEENGAALHCKYFDSVKLELTFFDAKDH